jgi:hypothetical protein
MLSGICAPESWCVGAGFARKNIAYRHDWVGLWIRAAGVEWSPFANLFVLRACLMRVREVLWRSGPRKGYFCVEVMDDAWILDGCWCVGGC